MSNEAEREAFYAYGESIGMPRLMLTIGEFKAFQAGAAWQRTQAQPSEKLVEALEEVITYPESGHEHELRSLLAASPKTDMQEPVGYVKYNSPIKGHTEFFLHEKWCEDGLSDGWIPLYAAPQPVSDDARDAAVNNVGGYAHLYSSGIGTVLEIKAEHARIIAAMGSNGDE